MAQCSHSSSRTFARVAWTAIAVLVAVKLCKHQSMWMLALNKTVVTQHTNPTHLHLADQSPNNKSSSSSVGNSIRLPTNNISRSGSFLPPPMLATDISNEVHDALSETTNENGVRLANLSSVDYFACCGLGHRLARMANAAWIAKRLNLALRTYWGYCGGNTEVFQHLFGPTTSERLEGVTSTNRHIVFRNEVNGFQTLQRWGANAKRCDCHPEQIAAHVEFYKDLRRRFRYKTYTDAFVNTTFANHVVLGMHVRAGNGEKGLFEKTERTIDNADAWVQNAVQRIRELVEKEQWDEPPLLYIATDTPLFVEKFRKELDEVMPVVEFPQERLGEGDGVLTKYEGNKKKISGRQCIRQWESAVADMILLSHADVLIAARHSSFEQTMPMSLVFGRESQKATTPKCELNLNASRMVCSKTYMDWCCNHSGLDLRVVQPLREPLRVPENKNMSFASLYQTKGRAGKESKRILPYYWKPKTGY